MLHHPFYKAVLLGLSAILLSFMLSTSANAQTTYHLHKESSSTSGLNQLKTAGPDAATSAITSANLKNLATGKYIVVEVPPSTLTGPVVITVGGQASSGITFTVTPKINNLSPTAGAIGTSVTILHQLLLLRLPRVCRLVAPAEFQLPRHRALLPAQAISLSCRRGEFELNPMRSINSRKDS